MLEPTEKECQTLKFVTGYDSTTYSHQSADMTKSLATR